MNRLMTNHCLYFRLFLHKKLIINQMSGILMDSPICLRPKQKPFLFNDRTHHWIQNLIYWWLASRMVVSGDMVPNVWLEIWIRHLNEEKWREKDIISTFIGFLNPSFTHIWIDTTKECCPPNGATLTIKNRKSIKYMICLSVYLHNNWVERHLKTFLIFN